MSRLTTTQIIAQGQYLEPDFQASSLTVSQLLGVLGYHNIKYPTPYSKPKLLQVFRDEVQANASRLKRQRLKAESSIASDDGIKDGVTGKPIGAGRRAPEAAPAPVRRASRRLSRAPIDTEEEAPPRPEPPKRRRSSAQPRLGEPSAKPSRGMEPPVAEESEPEEDDLPARKVSRSKKKTAPSSNRRQSYVEDSGWEDKNIFQSGAESSSPAHPPPRARSKRPTARKSRKSASAPPQSSPLSSPVRPSHIEGLAQSRFEPHLPLLPVRSRLLVSPRKEPDEEDLADAPQSYEEQEELEPQDASEVDDALQQAYQRDQNEPIEDDLPVALKDADDMLVERIPHDNALPVIVRILIWLLGLASAGIAYQYQLESKPLGYCDRNSDTNAALENLRSMRKAVQLCNHENRTTLYPGGASPCPLPSFLPIGLQPDSCTPCPEHAFCKRDTVECDTGYMLRSHPLLFFIPPVSAPTNSQVSSSSPPNELAWKVIAEVTNGLPGLGSVAFPPRCVEDPKRKRHIGALGKAVDHLLAQERGNRLCAGNYSEPIALKDGGEARQWGIELDSLRSRMKSVTAPHLLPTFDDMFNEAISQLVDWDGIIITEDSEGTRYIAHKTPQLTLACTLIVKSRGIWQAWRLTVFGIVLFGASVSALRARNSKNRRAMKRVADIVPTALKAIRDAEMAHHTDPITSPRSYVSSLQLRDLLLPHESLSERDALWKKVARVVELNTNVRANLEEADGGDEMRVWRWIGSAGIEPRVQKELPPSEQEEYEEGEE